MDRQVLLNRKRSQIMQQRQDRGPFFWVFGYTKKEGKPIVYGWFSTQMEANQWGFTYTDGNYEVYELPTKNRAAATSMIKAKRLNSEDIDLDAALQKVRHKGKDIGIEERGQNGR